MAVGKLNKAGIRRLADDLVANKKRYDQDELGNIFDECGTVACLTGLCYLRQIGLRKFNQSIKNGEFDDKACAFAGLQQLNLPIRRNSRMSTGVYLPQIFLNISFWPHDLQEEYESNGPTWRVIAALKALQRLLPNGKIDPDPKAVHTHLPQLAKLLKTAKKPA